MSIEQDLARRRNQANAKTINARHRRLREQAQRLAASQGAVSSPDGVSPQFAGQLDAARKRAAAALRAREEDPTRGPPESALDRLVREGKLPPRNNAGVGYEPTAEDVLGDLAHSEATAPDGTETLPDADAVLSGATEPSESDCGPAPGTSAAPTQPVGNPGLARPAYSGQHKSKRRK